MEEVLYSISQEIINATGAWGCNSFLFPERSKHGYYYLIEPEPSPEYKVPDPPDLFTREALETAKPVFAEDVMADPRTDKRTMRFFGIKSALAFPLVFHGSAVAAGFMCFDERRHMTDEEIEIVMAIAGTGAMAVANLKMHQSAVQLAVAQERNRLAKEMHDDACQSLAAVKMNLNTLLLTEELPDRTVEKIRDVMHLVDDSYDDLRDTIHSFRTAGIAGEEFVASFKDYTEAYEDRHDIEVDYKLSEFDIMRLSQSALLQTSRILGEALANVRKHASASRVRIESRVRADCVVIEVEDDGIGFDTEELESRRQGHFGLSIMEERARDAGGSLSVLSIEPHGTIVRFTIPYR